MASGVAVDPECLSVFEELKLKKPYRYVILGMSDDDKKIVVKKKANKDATYEEFLEDLKLSEDAGDCRYAIYDFTYKVEVDGMDNEKKMQEKNKILFYLWCPTGAKIKRKMLYTSSKDAIRKKLNGIQVEVQGNDFGDIVESDVLEKVLAKEK